MKQRKKTMVAVLLSLSMMLATCSGTISTLAASSTTTTSEITDMTTNYQAEPLGIETDNLRFGWQMQSNIIGIEQTSYQIVVTNEENGAIVWDSGVVNSGISSAIPYGGDINAFELETRYNWTVTVTDNCGGKQTATSWFETGTDWDNAQWITSQGWTSFYMEEQSFETNWGTKTEQVPVSGSAGPLFRTERQLENKKIEKARLYITSLGTYEAYINGRQVQKEVNSIMSPGYTDYSSYVNYQTYDVTDYLNNANDTVTLSAVVAGGWYDDIIGNHCNYESAIGQEELREHALYADLVITYEDGSEQSIVTDGDWNSTDDSFIESSGIYQNVSYNNQRAEELNGWTDAGFEDSNWDNAAVLGQANCDVRANPTNEINEYQTHPYQEAFVYTNTDDSGKPIVEQSYQAGEQIQLKAGQKLVLNFGQNASHTPHFLVSGATGTKLFLQPAEFLNENGIIDRGKTTKLRNFQYTLSGVGKEDYLNEFSFVGYQYLEVTTTSDITFEYFDAVAVTSLSAEQETGSLETSNELINQFIHNSKWSQMSNFCSVPMDCPTREYLGWSGDAQLFFESAMYHYDSAAFMNNYVEIMNDFYDQHNFYGDVMPYMYYCGGNKGQSCGWGDAGIIIPYYFYLQTGDKTLIQKYWNQMSECVNSIFNSTTMEPDQYNTGYTGVAFGDWLGIEISGYSFMTACFTVYLNELMAQMADIIGEDATIFKDNAEMMREYTINRFVDEEGNILSATMDDGKTLAFGGAVMVDNAQTALAWALKLGLYHTEEQKQTMVNNLTASVQNKDSSIRGDYGENTIATGFLGVNILLPSLSESGENETAFDLMTSTNLASFLYSVTTGATSIWENWTGGGSRNHYSYGAASEWLYEYAAGIQKDVKNPGFKHFILQPETDDSLTYLNGSYDSYYGNIVSNWTADQGNLTSYEAVVPANTTATLYLPINEDTMADFATVDGITYEGIEENNGQMTAKFNLQAGGYHFEVKDGKLVVSIADGYVINETADKDILNSVIAYAEQAKASGEYDNAIESVQKSFDATLENAKVVANNTAATQEEVDAAWQTLLNEIHKLGFVAGDKTELASLIEAANGINAELDRYVEAGKAEFTAALEAAQAVYQDGDAMQTEINQVADDLLNTMLNLRYKADKSVLEDVLAEAGKVDANAYTAESYAALEVAVAEANDVYNNENASQEEVDAAVTSVQTAMDNLVAVDGTPAETPTEDVAQTGQESTTPKANAAKTGDFAPIAGMAAIGVAGAALLFSRKKR
ncbi:family 78 glycoside hydrolase catalytic domain [Massilioclostridium coli]|uniref:family 78 glycoside hydrolase catalytic domain n=1 Tax=Massilioclostridium coli TaxID=1870991 RepID=UPI0022E12BDA|nr:family 78 glycoside hydrolase catalytic domain [Massilioclostridium coli]